MESTMVTSGAMTNRIDRLEQRGFVKRSKSPTDGRQVLVSLTKKGMSTVDAALMDHASNELHMVSSLDPVKREQLIELLRELHRALDRTAAGDGPGPE